jgi:hypothetical protein
MFEAHNWEVVDKFSEATLIQFTGGVDVCSERKNRRYSMLPLPTEYRWLVYVEVGNSSM